MRGLRRRCKALAVFVFLCTSSIPAQKRPVYVTASFTDRNDIFMENLTADEVEIREEEQPRKIEFLAMEQLPTVYGVLIESALLADSAGDTRYDSRGIPGANLARNILYELIDKYLRRHPVWIGAYQADLQVVLDFSGDAFAVKEAVERLRAPGRTSGSYLYSGLFSAVQKMSERNEKRRVLLLFLEAVDPETAGKARSLENLLAASNLELFVISFSSRLSTRGGLNPSISEAILKRLAGATSGAAFSAGASRDHPEDLSRRLLQHIRTLHTFGIESSSPPDHPGALSIRSTRPGSKAKHHPVVPVLSF